MHTVAGVAGVERAVGVGQAGVEIDPLATVVKRSTEQRKTRIPCARASSAIERILSAIRSSSIGPLLRAMSFVPARITTARGRSATTSHWNRANICAVTCPLIPRAAKPFASKNEG